MIAEQIEVRCPLENIAWQGGMVKIIPPSLVPTEGRNTGHEYSVAQFVIAMYKKINRR